MKETYFECPNCKMDLTATHDRRGQKEPCPGCGGVVTVPFKSLKRPQTTAILATKAMAIVLIIIVAIAFKATYDGFENRRKGEEKRAEELSKKQVEADESRSKARMDRIRGMRD